MGKALLLFILMLSIPVFGHYVEKPVQHVYKNLPSHIRTQVQCLADNIYFEARGEPVAGQIAVAMVTLNRVRSPRFPSSICQVVKQESNSTCQFSWRCEGKGGTAHRASYEYQAIRRLAVDLYVNIHRHKDVTRGATFYHATYVSVRRLGRVNIQKTTQIGRHIFYKERS